MFLGAKDKHSQLTAYLVSKQMRVVTFDIENVDDPDLLDQHTFEVFLKLVKGNKFKAVVVSPPVRTFVPQLRVADTGGGIYGRSVLRMDFKEKVRAETLAWVRTAAAVSQCQLSKVDWVLVVRGAPVTPTELDEYKLIAKMRGVNAHLVRACSVAVDSDVALTIFSNRDSEWPSKACPHPPRAWVLPLAGTLYQAAHPRSRASEPSRPLAELDKVIRPKLVSNDPRPSMASTVSIWTDAMSRAIANCLVSSGASDYTKVGRWGNTLVLQGGEVSSSSSQLPRYRGATDDFGCPRVDMPLS